MSKSDNIYNALDYARNKLKSATEAKGAAVASPYSLMDIAAAVQTIENGLEVGVLVSDSTGLKVQPLEFSGTSAMANGTAESYAARIFNTGKAEPAYSPGGDTSAFESAAMAIIGTPTGGGGGMTSRNSLYYFPFDTDYKSYGRNSTFELSAKGDDGFVPAQFNFGAKATGNIDVSTIFKSDFTVDFWSKVISARGEGIVNFYYLWMTGAEQPLLYYRFDGNAQYHTQNHAINGHSITPDDNWHHFAIVRSGTNVKTYMDGIEILSANVTDDLFLGGVNLDAAQYLQVDGGTINNTLNGYRSTPLTLDELHITDSALWTADFTPPTRANSLT